MKTLKCNTADHYMGVDYTPGETYQVEDALAMSLLRRWRQRGAQVVHNFADVTGGADAPPTQKEKADSRRYTHGAQVGRTPTPPAGDKTQSSDDAPSDKGDGDAEPEAEGDSEGSAGKSDEEATESTGDEPATK